MLGGILIPSELGLEGHSDADVLLHSITDAVLGALGWGDIGQWFPNTDPKFKNADSKFFLSEVWKRAAAEGWQLANCDCVVLAETPKLAPHMKRISESIAALFGSTPEQIGLKATTTETLGFVGRKEGMVASAVILLKRN